jgi:hypothetical protein
MTRIRTSMVSTFLVMGALSALGAQTDVTMRSGSPSVNQLSAKTSLGLVSPLPGSVQRTTDDER